MSIEVTSLVSIFIFAFRIVIGNNSIVCYSAFIILN